jgi:hypothetical protein
MIKLSEVFRPVLVLVFLVCGFSAPLEAAPVAVAADQYSVVRVNVTNQDYDFFRPWGKDAPYTRRGLGAVLPDNRVLVTAELVANSNYVELERAESGERTSASVDVVDYEANLAILRPDGEAFLDGLKPLELTDSVVGDSALVQQVESTGAILATPALVTTVEVGDYPLDDTALLIYRMTSSLQYRESSFTMPILRDGKLTGMLMRFDSRTQNVDVVPKPVIEHFLLAAEKKPYGGFPRAGINFATMRDPQLRRFAGLPQNIDGGVYLTDVVEGGPAGKAGMKSGDVILEIDGMAIDQDGNYSDPIYGEVSLINLISTKHYNGDRIPLKIFRGDGEKEVFVTLEHRDAADFVIPPYTIDEPPNYFILGGLVLQELSRQYLKEWGNDWEKKAPERFVYYDKYQSELFHDDRKHLVILSQIIPTGSTVGYEDIGSSVVTRINDLPLKSLADAIEAAKHPIDGFHKIEIEEDPRVIYLDASQVEGDNAALLNRYGLPSLQRISGE